MNQKFVNCTHGGSDLSNSDMSRILSGLAPPEGMLDRLDLSRKATGSYVNDASKYRKESNTSHFKSLMGGERPNFIDQRRNMHLLSGSRPCHLLSNNDISMDTHSRQSGSRKQAPLSSMAPSVKAR